MTAKKTTRRGFLATSAVTASALSLTAESYARIPGANDTIRVGFLGTGGRCQQHIDVIVDMRDEGKKVVPFAVCDVWDGDEKLGKRTNDPKKRSGRGLLPSAKTCGIPADAGKGRFSKDYRDILANKDVDVVCIGTPDHWHARMAVDAMEAGKDVYCEKPMTKTIAEAQLMVKVAAQTGRVVTVGVQSMADPTWQEAYKYIAAGNLGHVFQGTTSYYRNSLVGQWRYYPLAKDMTPKTIDWDMWLGHGFEVAGEKLGPAKKDMPFDRAVWAQWRCYWPFGGGMFTDLFVHQTTHLIAAMGVRYPRRVVGGGGIYLEYDTRDVPDVATVVADYDEGCQVLVMATMANDHRVEECIRGHSATIIFDNYPTDPKNPKSPTQFGMKIVPQSVNSAPRGPSGAVSKEGEIVFGGLVGDDTYALWANFLEHVKAKDQGTLSTPELGAAAFSTVNMGAKSYREGKAFFWDKEQRKPVEADATWAAAWEKRSKERGKPNQVMGWTGGDAGSKLTPPEYQKLAGPWVDGKDPAGA